MDDHGWLHVDRSLLRRKLCFVPARCRTPEAGCAFLQIEKIRFLGVSFLLNMLCKYMQIQSPFKNHRPIFRCPRHSTKHNWRQCTPKRVPGDCGFFAVLAPAWVIWINMQILYQIYIRVVDVHFFRQLAVTVVELLQPRDFSTKQLGAGWKHHTSGLQ